MNSWTCRERVKHEGQGSSGRRIIVRLSPPPPASPWHQRGAPLPQCGSYSYPSWDNAGQGQVCMSYLGVTSHFDCDPFIHSAHAPEHPRESRLVLGTWDTSAKETAEIPSLEFPSQGRLKWMVASKHKKQTKLHSRVDSAHDSEKRECGADHNEWERVGGVQYWVVVTSLTS